VLEASLGGTCHQTELGRAGVAGCTADDSMACCGDLRVGEEGEESVVLGLCHAHAPRDPSVFEVTLEETTPCIPRPEQSSGDKRATGPSCFEGPAGAASIQLLDYFAINPWRP
jgi:hypothetical protein